jgi:hypothetical protein
VGGLATTCLVAGAPAAPRPKIEAGTGFPKTATGHQRSRAGSAVRLLGRVLRVGLTTQRVLGGGVVCGLVPSRGFGCGGGFVAMRQGSCYR